MTEPAAGSPAKVLVVDDQKGIRLIVERICEGLGLSVFSAADADGAIEQALHVAPDLYIVDMVMPEVDGVEFLSNLLAGGGDPRVIVMSGYGDAFMNIASALPALYRNGRIWKIRKPFRKEAMEALIRTALAA